MRKICRLIALMLVPLVVTPTLADDDDRRGAYVRAHYAKFEYRVMIQIQSTWFPLVDRNPQTWVENIFEAVDKDFVKATNRVYRSKKHPSRVRIGVLP